MSMDERSIGFLRATLWDQETDPKARRSAATQLGEHDAANSIGLLIEALEGRDVGEREAAEAALICLGAPVTPAVIAALADETARHRYNSISQKLHNRAALVALLGKVGDRTAIAPLVRALDEQDRYLRLAAAEALDALAARHPVPELRVALPPLRQGVAWVPIPYLSHLGEIIRRIETATKDVRDLPVPAARPPPATDDLPVPAQSPPSSPDGLPIPAAASEDAGTGAGVAPAGRRGTGVGRFLRRWLTPRR